MQNTSCTEVLKLSNKTFFFSTLLPILARKYIEYIDLILMCKKFCMLTKWNLFFKEQNFSQIFNEMFLSQQTSSMLALFTHNIYPTLLL